MTVRRVNSTDRKRIRQQDVVVRLYSDGASSSFDASIDLSSYALPANALMSIEAYRQTTRLRYPWGTVSVPVIPSHRALDEFDHADAVLFRVRVTDANTKHGLLLAEADQIKPIAADDEDSNRVPLLPPAPGDLGDEIWRVEFSGAPILRINERLPDWKEAIRSDQFRSLVYPAAIRQVLLQIILVEGYSSSDGADDWQSRWLLFASSIPGVRQVPSGKEEQLEWIDEVSTAYARNFGMRRRYEKDFFGLNGQ